MENNNLNSATSSDNSNLNNTPAPMPVSSDPVQPPVPIIDPVPVAVEPMPVEPAMPEMTETPMEPAAPIVEPTPATESVTMPEPAAEPTVPASEPIPAAEPLDPMSAVDKSMTGEPINHTDASALGSVYGGIPSDPNSPENSAPYSEPQPPMARKSHGLMFALIGFAVFLLLLFSAAGVIVMAAYGKINLPDKKMQEALSYYVQNIPFMPKTSKYVLLKSAEVHKDIGSAYTKISFSAKSAEFKQIPGIGDTLEFLIEGPVDSSNPENPKISWNLKLTKELDLDFKVIDKTLYFRVNKIPALIYPFIGLTSANFASNPLLNRWVSYDISSMDTDASKMLDERGENVTMDEVTEQKLILIGEKLANKMVMTNETVDGVNVYKITLKLTNAELQELEPELVELLELDKSTYDTTYTSASSPFGMVDDLEVNVWIEKETYYMRRFDAVLDLHETAMNDYSQVLGITTIQNENSSDKVVSLAMSASLSQLGEKFEADFVPPAGAVSFQQYMLEVGTFFDQIQSGNNMSDDELNQSDDLSGFEDPQIYSPPTGKNPGLEEMNDFGY